MINVLSYAILVLLAQNAMSNTILTEADAGSAHQVKQGETIELRLKENPSTGYRWTIEVEPPGAATVSAASYKPGGPQLGANGTRVFEIAVKGQGPVRLNARLGRSWEGEDAAAERKSFILEAR